MRDGFPDRRSRIVAATPSLIARATERGPTGLLVVGAPGTGKSTLLDAVVRATPGPRWHTSAGRTPTVAHGTTDPAQALAAAVAAAGQSRATLWALDDLDRSGPDGLRVPAELFATGASVAVVATARRRVPGWPGWTVTLDPLPDDLIAAELSSWGTLHPIVRDVLVRAADGNPGIARALARGLTAAELDGSDLLPHPLPVGHDAVELAAGVLAASDADERSRIVADAVDTDGHPQGHASPVTWFVHAVLFAIGGDERRAAHRRAAERTANLEAATIHAALGAEGADDDLARRVADIGDAAAGDGRLDDALRHLAAAHRVAGDPVLRRGLAHRAAVLAVLARRRSTAERWSVRARNEVHGGPAQFMLGAVARTDAHANEARDELRTAVRRGVTEGRPERTAMLVQAMVAGLAGALPDIDHDVAAARDTLAAGVADDEQAVLGTSIAICEHLADGDVAARSLVGGAAQAVLARLRSTIAEPEFDQVTSAPTRIAQYLGMCSMVEERWELADALLTGASDLEAARGWHGAHSATMGWLAELRWRQGRWADVDDAVRSLLRQPGADEVWGGMLVATATRADVLAGTTDATSTFDVAAAPGLSAVVERHGLALGALGAGADDVALLHLRAVAAALDGVLDHPGLVWWRGDFVEALAACGRPDEARRELERFAALVDAWDTPVLRGQLLRARAAVLPAGRARSFLQRAVKEVAAVPVPFERARSQLALAAALRGDDDERSRAAAREARAGFEAVGAAVFARRAAALGAASITDAEAALSTLTERGAQVARLAAAGRTNGQIAATTGLSPKTVEFHLGKVFRALSISRRTQLPAALAGDDRA